MCLYECMCVCMYVYINAHTWCHLNIAWPGGGEYGIGLTHRVHIYSSVRDEISEVVHYQRHVLVCHFQISVQSTIIKLCIIYIA